MKRLNRLHLSICCTFKQLDLSVFVNTNLNTFVSLIKVSNKCLLLKFKHSFMSLERLQHIIKLEVEQLEKFLDRFKLADGDLLMREHLDLLEQLFSLHKGMG